MGCTLSVRDTLLSQDVKEAAIDYDAKKAYIVPADGFKPQDAIAALKETGRYTATVGQ